MSSAITPWNSAFMKLCSISGGIGTILSYRPFVENVARPALGCEPLLRPPALGWKMWAMPGDDVHRASDGDGFRVCAEGRHVLLGEGEVVIGRSSYCSLVLDHETLSRV